MIPSPPTTITSSPDATDATRYHAPDGFTRKVLNPIVRGLTSVGISAWGARVLEVRGRRSGELRSTPVNVLVVDGVEYLVAPRGVTDWVRNVRVAGTASLRVGRRRRSFRLDELGDDAKPEILRAYLRRWRWEVGQFFDGVDADAGDDELRAIAAGYPVFRLTAV